MSLSILLTPLVLIAMVIFIAWPLLGKSQEKESRQESELESAIQEKEALISNLKDLEMDYRMGKLSEEDYNGAKADLEAKAINAIERVDLLRRKD